MKISTFALSVKKSSNANQGIKKNQKIVKGYFLTISNLVEQDFRLRIEFTLTQTNLFPENTNLEEKAILAYKLGKETTYLSLNQSPTTSNSYSSYFTIPAKETVSIELLPNLNNHLLFYNDKLEFSGSVSLLLPANFNFRTLRVESQSEIPIEFSLCPEIRSTIIEDDSEIKSPANLNFEQIVSSLGIINEKPSIILEPEPGYPLFFKPDIISNISLP